MSSILQDLLAEARRLYPTWTDAQCLRWAHARAYSRRCEPTYAKLMPLELELETGTDGTMSPRTLREAGMP
jgi:hypothetical protein